ncbi:hypothetical protein DPMN_158364 [Dreissena polymorpha]|uniref:Uncharacterized protein n=1 Tax=Dreissena polymorpha TaxID=45954 RepID=A0A9D4IPQ5_DREPO|nr:hypothetical protein DPMN_158364 [Dreissena polymorpha]
MRPRLILSNRSLQTLHLPSSHQTPTGISCRQQCPLPGPWTASMQAWSLCIRSQAQLYFWFSGFISHFVILPHNDLVQSHCVDALDEPCSLWEEEDQRYK